MRENLPADVFMEIKLDTLVENPEKQLAEFCVIMGINMYQRLLAAANGLNRGKARIGRWEREFAHAEAEFCRRRLHPLMASYGYS